MAIRRVGSSRMVGIIGAATFLALPNRGCSRGLKPPDPSSRGDVAVEIAKFRRAAAEMLEPTIASIDPFECRGGAEVPRLTRPLDGPCS